MSYNSVDDLPLHYQAQARAKLSGQPVQPLKIGGQVKIAGQDGGEAVLESGAEQRIVLPFPPTANNFKLPVIVRGRARMVLSNQARLYKIAAAEIVAAAGLTPLSGPVAVELNLYRRKRTGDLDNGIKIPLDCLKGAAWHDDEQVVKITAERFEDRDNPRVEIIWRAAEQNRKAT